MASTVVSRGGRLLVEARRACDGDPTGTALTRFVERRGRTWSPGRLTLTRLHLSYLPGAAARGAPLLNVPLTAIEAVEISEGRIARTVSVRTPTHTAHFRCTGASAFALAVAEAAESAREAPGLSRLA